MSNRPALVGGAGRRPMENAPLKLTSPLARGLHLTALAPLLPQLLGSAFNIWYNLTVVLPLLKTPELQARFMQTCVVYNAVAYPITVYLWLRAVYGLWPVYQALRLGAPVPADRLLRNRRRLIHLPWIGAGLSGMAWGLCIPVFLVALLTTGETFDRMLFWHLPISFLVSAFIAITHSFFAVEISSHRQLFATFFAGTRADLTPDTHTLTLRGRGLLWAISAGVCPIISVLLISFAPPAPGSDPAAFAVYVAFWSIAFSLATAVMIGQLVAQPVEELRAAAQSVAEGRLDAEVPVRRADEFGLLAGEFNRMLGELREKQRLQQTFGLHVGRRAAEQILARDPGLSGVEQVISVMFVDIRSFTRRSASAAPAEVVAVLNEFLRLVVQVVEEGHGGMINKFLGDGVIALFGVGAEGTPHADQALAAGRQLLAELPGLNARLAARQAEPLAIGIGIHTGPAIVGSIGSPQRLEFTAIGATVNLASRIEGLTKVLQIPLLATVDTQRALQGEVSLRAVPPQEVRGLAEPIGLFTCVACGE